MARRSIRTGFVAGALTLGVIATGCGSSSGGSSASDQKVFTDYAYLSDSGTNTSFDPGVVQTLSESQITTALYDGLTDFDFSDPAKPELKGNVAASWEANSDATEYTFKIKPNEVFSDGSAVLPSSFKAGWERAGSPKLASPYGYLINNVEGGAAWNSGCSDATPPKKPADCKAKVDESKGLASIAADDKAMTLKVTLAAPNADFPSIVSHPFFSPVNAKDLAKIGETSGWGTKGLTIGNGPFKLDSANTKEVVLVPNTKWGGNVLGDTKVKLDKLVFKQTIDVETAYQAFEAGEGDDAPVPAGKYADAQAAYPQNTITTTNVGSYYFDFGEDDPQVGGPKNVKLRQAISLAIDRKEINKKVYEDTRPIATGITPPGIPGYKKDICKFCDLDVTKAKSLLKEWKAAGGKLTKPIKINFNEGGSHGDVATIIQANLKDNLGIDAELGSVAEDYFVVVAEPGGCQLCRSGWYADYPTYGNFMVDLFSKASIGGNNFGRFDNAEFEGIIAKAQAETDDTKRGELYNQAEDVLLNQETGAVPLVFYTGSQVFRDSVKAYPSTPLGIMLWEKVDVPAS